MTSAGYLVNHMARLFADELRKRIAPLGIVPGQFPALLVLWEKDGLTQKELLALLDIEQATLANTLTRMERDGLIVRREHPADARARTIHLSEKARAIRDSAYEAAKETNEEALSGLTDGERQSFLDCMSRTITALQEGGSS
ncbi:DNA-binding MarR family transcriptional regulator [Litoreibacter halocynthiae]|uniref:DNA-binding MarR family transcriptional regulator n=2 Tax=Litoreibacter halocynthiae TaxID=1242689 RepID=A0A4R7LIL7_9RHOB|nr:DNA-binding MarR family transcriptional regulator [Litoreibacter halocynthiae]